MAGGIKLGASEVPPGRQWSVGHYALHFTAAGNLELWNSISRRLLWQSGTNCLKAGKLAMQKDGNLVIYDLYRRPLWSSGTDGNPAAYLALQDDGKLVIYSQDNRPLWDAALA